MLCFISKHVIQTESGAPAFQYVASISLSRKLSPPLLTVAFNQRMEGFSQSVSDTVCQLTHRHTQSNVQAKDVFDAAHVRLKLAFSQ